jgi:hypothetical protein
MSENIAGTVSEFESAINFMNKDDKSRLLNELKKQTALLDMIRDEKLIDLVPQLKEIL